MSVVERFPSFTLCFCKLLMFTSRNVELLSLNMLKGKRRVKERILLSHCLPYDISTQNNVKWIN